MRVRQDVEETMDEIEREEIVIPTDGGKEKEAGGRKRGRDRAGAGDIVSRYRKLEGQLAALRLACALLLAALAGSLLVAAYLGSLPKTVPYVIEIDSDANAYYDPNAVKMLENWTPNDELKRAFIKDYVVSLRSVSIDNYINKENINNVYSKTVGAAADSINSWYESNNPIERSATARVSIPGDALMVLKYSDTQWRVTWRETETARTGQILSDRRYEGIFNIEYYTPSDERQLLDNPLGLYVASFDISYTQNLM